MLKPAHHATALLKLLDTAYREILALEARRGVTVSRDDLRPRIEHYHDVIRAWSADGDGKAKERSPHLSVAHIAASLEHLRAEADRAYEGVGTFFPHIALKEAVRLKRRLLAAPQLLHGVPPAQMLDDLNALLETASALAPADLEALIAARDIVTLPRSVLKEARWKKLPSKTLLPKLETALSKRGAALLEAWIRSRPPLALARAARVTAEAYSFDAASYVPESEWSSLEQEARTLAGLYEKYALLFAAATAAPVDRDYKDRKEEMDAAVSDIALLIEIALEMSGQKLDQAMIEDLAAYCESEKAYEEILAVLLHRLSEERRKRQNAVSAHAVAQSLQELNRQVEAQGAALEQAHFSFLANQLSLYESSRELVKKLAQQGLNLAGRFVQGETGRGTGRGAGRER